MSRILVTRPKAARDYPCIRQRAQCQGIRQGDVYVREAAPPDSEELVGGGWLTARSCVFCFEADVEARFEWVRSRYSVPARKGGRVRFTGYPVPIEGEIVDVRDGYVVMRGQNKGGEFLLHPTWEVEYLTEGAEVLS